MCVLPRRNSARGDMLGNEGTNGAAEGDELLSAMAIGGQAIVPINLLSEMAQRYSSFSRDLAQPIPDQGLEVHRYWIGLSTCEALPHSPEETRSAISGIGMLKARCRLIRRNRHHGTLAVGTTLL